MEIGEVAKRALIEATIREIEAHGLSSVTVRGIATRAEMNVAAVNYHFGSKAKLLAIALGSTLEHMHTDAAQILAKDGQAEAVLAELLTYLLDGTLRYPRVTQAHLARVSDEDEASFPDQLRELIKLLCAWFATRGQPEPLASSNAATCISAVLFPASFAPLFAGLQVFDTPDGRAGFVARLVAQSLG